MAKAKKLQQLESPDAYRKKLIASLEEAERALREDCPEVVHGPTGDTYECVDRYFTKLHRNALRVLIRKHDQLREQP